MTSIRIILREIRRAYDTCKRNRGLVSSMADYLLPGVYRNAPSGDSIYLIGSTDIIKGTYSSFKKTPSFAKVVANIIYYSTQYRIINRKSEPVFTGSQLILSSSQKELKVFDFERKMVLTKYASLEKLLKYNDDKELFAHSYNVAKTISIDEHKSIIIEQLIPHKSFDSELFFPVLVQSMIRHTRSFKTAISGSNEDFKKHAILFASRFGDSRLLEWQIKLPTIVTHGDLWSSNVISNGRELFITDFERTGNRYFLYDFFTYIFSEWLLNNNPSLLNRYFHGDYDTSLEEMFTALGESYSTNNKESYLLLFLISYTSERWTVSSSNDERVVNFLKIYIPSYFTIEYEQKNNSNIGR